jgi:hypothetical protein
MDLVQSGETIDIREAERICPNLGIEGRIYETALFK